MSAAAGKARPRPRPAGLAWALWALTILGLADQVATWPPWTAEVLAAVDQTMQPTRASLWLACGGKAAVRNASQAGRTGHGIGDAGEAV